MSVTVRLETVTTSKEAGCTTYAPKRQVFCRGSSFNKDRLFLRHALLPFDCPADNLQTSHGRVQL